jgi:hypothetical protein
MDQRDKEADHMWLNLAFPRGKLEELGKVKWMDV